MKQESKQLLDYIINVIGIKKPEMPNYYHSLPVCIIDDIFSLQSHYENITFPTVKRFSDYFLNGDLYTDKYTIDNFIFDLEKVGVDYIRTNILRNSQKVGGRRKIEVCYDVAKALKRLNIQTMADFDGFSDKEYLSYVLHSIKGVGDAAVDYLFMMAGDNNRVKPDIHIHHCIKDAIGHDISNEECQNLFREVTERLIKDLPYATPRFLDGLVWNSIPRLIF